MVDLKAIKDSNSKIASTLPPELVAVFVGATSGIGEYTLRAFARHTVRPRVYFVGRSQKAADRIAKECKALNPEGTFTFIKADVGIVKNVDGVCRDIMSKETAINLLCLSQGTLSVTGGRSAHHL